MKWAILRIAKGKEEIIEVGDRSKLSNRLKQLRSSTRNGVSGRGRKKYPITYKLQPFSEETELE